MEIPLGLAGCDEETFEWLYRPADNPEEEPRYFPPRSLDSRGRIRWVTNSAGLGLEFLVILRSRILGTWSYFIQYVQESVHRPEKVAGFFLTGTLVAFGVGRFASASLMRFIAPNKLMGAYSVVNIMLVSIGVLLPGWIGLWSVFLTSFFMSLMFPTIFALGLKGLGPNTKIGGSLIVMAIVGGAVLTPLMGLISERTGSIAPAYSVPLFAYVVIALYSFFGSKQHKLRSGANA